MNQISQECAKVWFFISVFCPCVEFDFCKSAQTVFYYQTLALKLVTQLTVSKRTDWGAEKNSTKYVRKDDEYKERVLFFRFFVRCHKVLRLVKLIEELIPQKFFRGGPIN